MKEEERVTRRREGARRRRGKREKGVMRIRLIREGRGEGMDGWGEEKNGKG